MSQTFLQSTNCKPKDSSSDHKVYSPPNWFNLFFASQKPKEAKPSPNPSVNPIKPQAAAQSPELKCFMAANIQLLKVVAEPQKPIPNSNWRRGASGSPANNPSRPAPRVFTRTFWSCRCRASCQRSKAPGTAPRPTNRSSCSSRRRLDLVSSKSS